MRSMTLLKRSYTDRERLVKRASLIKKAQFVKYEPFHQAMRKDKLSAMFIFLVINARRLTLLFMAMFVLEKQWLQMTNWQS